MFRRIASMSKGALVALTALVTVLATVGVGLASDGFSDVSDTNPFHDEIGWMADTGISTGYPDGTFRPGTDVTRQAMAAFMYRLAEALTPKILTDTEGFSDTPTAVCVLGPYTPDSEEQVVFNGGLYGLSEADTGSGGNYSGGRVRYRADGGSWVDVTGDWSLGSGAPEGEYSNGIMVGAQALSPGVSYEFAIDPAGGDLTGTGNGCQLTATIFHRMPGQTVGGTTP